LTLPERKKDGLGRCTYEEELKSKAPECHANALEFSVIVPIVSSDIVECDKRTAWCTLQSNELIISIPDMAMAGRTVGKMRDADWGR
jgi:hypothetical protein